MYGHQEQTTAGFDYLCLNPTCRDHHGVYCYICDPSDDYQ